MNREEQIANAEKATVDSIREQRFAKTAELVKIPGHPLHTFTLENEALVKTIEKCREALKNGHVEYKLIEEVRQLAEEKERRLQRVTLAIQDKFGKNAMLKGMNLLEGGTTIERNGQIGGHKAGDE